MTPRSQPFARSLGLEANPLLPLLHLADAKTISLLNKLADSNFDSIVGQLVALVNASAPETLIIVARRCYETAISQPGRAASYAGLCRALREQISPEVHGKGVHNAAGKPVVGGALFRKLLLVRLQEEFETVDPGDARRYLGIVSFMAEIFKVHMLTERIMHECIQKLLGDSVDSFGEPTEAVCVLLDTCGSSLDTPRAQ
ncbi:armadillo-type protein [Mycena polygramma]|nr:armadillo-type protein [Mycena polygramma]